MKPTRVVPEKHTLLFWALGLAFVIRFFYWKLSQQSPFYAPLLLDAHYYDGWARQIAIGNLGEGVFYGLPLYPFVLGVIYKFTVGSFVVAKWFQFLLGVATVAFIYKIGRELFDARVAAVSAFLAAIYGPLFFHEAILIPEALGVPLYALAFIFVLRFWDKPTLRCAVGLGVLCGLAALTKAGVLLFVFLFAAYALFQKKPMKPVLIFLTATMLMLLPVTLHNVVKGKDLVLLTSHSGFNFYVGNNPKAEGTFDTPPGVGSNVESQRMDSKLVAERALGRELKPSEVSRYWSDRAWEFIRSEPGRFLALCGRKLILFFDARELSDVDDYAFGRHFNPLLRWPWPNFGVLAVLFFAGLVPLALSSRKAPAIIWIAAYLMGLMAFFVNARYRLPMLSVFIPVASAGLVSMWDGVRQRQLHKILFPAVLALLGFIVSQAHLVGTDPSRDFVNAGDARAIQKDPVSAQNFYEEALRKNPDNPKAQLAMGLNLGRLGRADEAKAYYLKTLELDPDNYQAHNNLGLWFADRGDNENAVRHFTQALQSNPGSYQAHNNMGMLYGKMGDTAAAAKAFEESIRLNPEGARAHMNLGLIRYQQGDRAGAKMLWERALALDPGFEDPRRALSLLNQVVSQ